MRENDPALLPATGQPTPEQVVAYLRTHPDFFSCCPDLLQDLSPPARWTGDKVVDLQHYMVSVLRDELAGLLGYSGRDELIHRDNLALLDGG